MKLDEAVKTLDDHADWLTQWSLAADSDAQLYHEQDAIRTVLAEVERLRAHEDASAQFLAERDELRKELEKVLAKIEAALAIIQEALDSGMVSGDSCGHLLLAVEALKGEEG